MIAEEIIDFEHTVENGLYTRVAYAKQGQIIVGCTHRKGGVAMLLEGTIQQIDGEDAYEISSPRVFNTQPGTQRVALAVTDCVYATVHAVLAVTVEEAEREVFVEMPQVTRIRNSFNSLLLEHKVEESQIQAHMNEMDHVLEGSDIYEIRPSNIQGLGAFTLRDVQVGEFIAFAQIADTRLGTARFVNHSDLPNAKFIDYKDVVALIAIQQIRQGNEILVNYLERITKCQE